ncbi:MAG: hypothetical protein R3E01_33260 [Pirellulaceae bacterium]|nr:hypothetical protein [Planctomycetales bacterium]
MSLRTSAEVVLDDFEVPQSISAPGDLVKTGAQYLGVTPPKPVGGIAALRELGIYGLGGVPHAYASSNLTLPGMLLLDKTDLLILPGEDNALMSFDIVYSLPNLGVDLTEGGANGGILVDFHSLSPNALPESLNVYIQQDQAVYYRFLNQLEYIPTSSLDRPFSLFIPFDTFSTRGIPSSFERFTNVQRMVFSVFNGYESAADSSSYPYTIALDSVRIGNAVPEPPAIFGIAAVIFFSPVRRRRFLACHKKGEE